MALMILVSCGTSSKVTTCCDDGRIGVFGGVFGGVLGGVGTRPGGRFCDGQREADFDHLHWRHMQAAEVTSTCVIKKMQEKLERKRQDVEELDTGRHRSIFIRVLIYSLILVSWSIDV
jgi:hypothetical protein